MKRLLLFLCVALPLFATAQASLKNTRKKSWQTYAYRITAGAAAQFIQWDSIPVNQFLDAAPCFIFQTDSVDENKLSVGNYVLIGTSETDINARLVCISDLIALTVNNRQRLQVDVRTRAGRFADEAKVFINNREAVFSEQSKTWRIKNKKNDGATLKIYIPGDTLFTRLEAKDETFQTIAEQRKYNYKHSRLYSILNLLPAAIKSLFKPNLKTNRIGASGYVIFNQPKYKPLDTVKFKAYVVDKKWNVYKKAAAVYLNYRNKGRYIEQLIATVHPTNAGSYLGSFVLADSIPADISCNLVFKTAGNKEIIKERFRIEDYLLDEMGTYTFQSESDRYFKNDTLHFFAGAKDANGLPVLDATATLVLTVKNISRFYRDTIFIADTIYKKEVKLSADSNTKFSVPAAVLPGADISINASLIFKNSNNELHEENKTVDYKYFSREIILTQAQDSIKALYIENGVAAEKNGLLEMNDDTAVAIHFPCTIKIDPIAEDYTFYTKEADNKNILTELIDVENDYHLQLSRVSNNDTLRFVFDNPFAIPVYFTVFDGSKIIASGKQSQPQVSWKTRVLNKRRLFKVRWQYTWAGKEKYGEENIGLFYKLLNVQLSAKTTIFPGQQDSILINVKDYRGHPAPGVNLSLVSYNNQFKTDRLPSLPYLANYKRRHYLQRDGFVTDGPISFDKRYRLGSNKSWIGKFQLDTLPYYKLLFPPAGYFDAVTLIGQFIPQVSVTAIDQGVPQEIYLLYLNRDLVYYNGTTDSMKYAFQVYPGYVQAGIRLKDKYIEIDSLYIQANYKHDISFDIDHLPPHSRVMPATNYWSFTEINLIERSMWQMENTYQNNSAFVWQDNRVVKLSGNHFHLAGPFRQSQMQFFNPGNFDIAFTFEPGYRYNLSKQVLRLEKQPIFLPGKKNYFLPFHSSTAMVLGDTLQAPPEIAYMTLKQDPFLTMVNSFDHRQYENSIPGMADLQLSVLKDSTLQYIVLIAADSAVKPLVLPYATIIKNLLPGKYTITLVTRNFYKAVIENVLLSPDGTNCIGIGSVKFYPRNESIDRIVAKAAQEIIDKSKIVIPDTIPAIVYKALPDILNLPAGGGSVYGEIMDDKGKNPVPFVSISIGAYKWIVQSDAMGNFILDKLRPGKYTLVFSAVGYQSAEAVINCIADERLHLKIILKVSREALQEVVVTGYGLERKRDLAGSISLIKSEVLSFNMLAGRVAGVSITSQDASSATPGMDALRRIRGISSTGNGALIYIIDGIPYDELPKNFNPADVLDVNVLSGGDAVALYGSRATSGAVVIKTNTKNFRKDFRDYAFWEPDILTDKNGRISVPVSYPDNITGWKTFAFAMSKKGSTGKAAMLTQAYKPIVAQLNVPRFLIAGDSTVVIGKMINHTPDKYIVNTAFAINSKPEPGQSAQLLPNEARIDESVLTAIDADTIHASFTLETTTGFSDGEERAIPVYKKGIEEAIGNFWILKNDSSFSFATLAGSKEVNLYAQNNTLDMLLEELDHLKKYPYYCMEQIASKIAGLAMEKKIKEQLKQSFKDQAMMEKLLQKLQKAQLFNGGWPWWENGKANFYITCYITNALLPLRTLPLVETNIRNAFLYLQNQLPFLDRPQLLTALATLSEGKHEMNYAQWMNAIPFDSLTQHQQWLCVKVGQQQQLDYRAALQKLVDKKTSSQLGAVHWGVENYTWYNDETATTIIAYDVLKNESAYKELTPKIIQYFLERRKGGYYTNTVASAAIVNAILPAILAQQKDFTRPATLSISGDTSFVVGNFPYQAKLNTARIKNLYISKAGGGMVYFTAWQNIFNEAPQAVSDKFLINSFFTKNNQPVISVKAGESIVLVVTVDVLKDADYVMLQVPVPAGCTYTAGKNTGGNYYQELYKDHVRIFVESLPKGMHRFEITLDARYRGAYTINPVKAELMYYPVFFGRNEMKKIAIER